MVFKQFLPFSNLPQYSTRFFFTERKLQYLVQTILCTRTIAKSALSRSYFYGDGAYNRKYPYLYYIHRNMYVRHFRHHFQEFPSNGYITAYVSFYLFNCLAVFSSLDRALSFFIPSTRSVQNINTLRTSTMWCVHILQSV